MRSPALVMKWDFVLKCTRSVWTLVIEPILSINWDLNIGSFDELWLSSLNFFNINHTCFTNRTWFFSCNFIKIISYFCSVFKDPKHIKNPIFKFKNKSNYFCRNTNFNGLHSIPYKLWGSVVGVLQAPSRHILNHTSMCQTREIKFNFLELKNGK